MDKKIIFVLAIVLIFIGVVSSEKILEINLEVFKNDSVDFHKIKLREGNPSFYLAPGDYKIEILDSEGKKIFEKTYKLSFMIFSDPPKPLNSSILYLKVPYDPKMKLLRIFHGEKEIFSKVINLCNKNGKCDLNYETFLSCPRDCPLNEADGVCIKDADGVCDPDCISGADPDCKVTTTLPEITTPLVTTTIFIPQCGNGNCDKGENYGSCPQDCPSGVSDGYCDRVKDKKCDPDCEAKEDPDCEKGFPFFFYLFLGLIMLGVIFFWVRKKKEERKKKELKEWIKRKRERKF